MKNEATVIIKGVSQKEIESLPFLYLGCGYKNINNPVCAMSDEFSDMLEMYSDQQFIFKGKTRKGNKVKIKLSVKGKLIKEGK